MESYLSILNQLAKTIPTSSTLTQSIRHGQGVFLKNHSMKTQVAGEITVFQAATTSTTIESIIKGTTVAIAARKLPSLIVF